MKRYEKENLVILKVPHERVMVGETDELLCRRRSSKCEKLILDILESSGVSEPEWFFERWVDEEKQMYVTAVFEDRANAELFTAAVFKEDNDYVWHDVGNKKYEAFLDAEVKYFNEKFEDAHKEMVAKMRERISKLGKTDIYFRTVIASLQLEKLEDDRSEMNKLGAYIGSVVKTDDNDKPCKLEYAPMLSKDDKKLYVAFIFNTVDDRAIFAKCVSKFNDWKFEDACDTLKKLNEGEFNEVESEATLAILSCLKNKNELKSDSSESSETENPKGE